MTYNVRYFSQGVKGLTSSSKRIDAVAAAIAKRPRLPDLIMLQEVERRSIRSHALIRKDGRTQLDILSESLNRSVGASTYVPVYFPAHAYSIAGATLYTTGLAMLYRADRLELQRSAEHDLTQVAGPFALHKRLHRLKQRRLAAEGVFLLKENQRLFRVANTHLSLPDIFSAQTWKKPYRMGFGPNQFAETSRLHSLVETWNDLPLLLAGDFNARPNSESLSVLEQSLRRVPLSDGAWSTAHFAHLRLPIDHIFHSQALQLVNSTGSAHVDDRNSPFYRLSDHVPLFADFELD